MKYSHQITSSLIQSVLVAPIGFVLWNGFFPNPLGPLSCIVLFGFVFAAYTFALKIVGRLIPITWENRFFILLLGGALFAAAVLGYLIVAQNMFGAYSTVSLVSFAAYVVTLTLIGATLTWLMGHLT